MAILDALGLKAVGLKRRFLLPTLFTWLFSKNRTNRRPISYLGFFVACGLLSYGHIQQLYLTTVLESLVLDAVSPVISALQKPVQVIADVATNFTHRRELHGEITRLRQQNENLLLVNTALKQAAFVQQDMEAKARFADALAKALPELQLLKNKYHITTTLNQPALGQPLFINMTDMGVEKNDIVLGAKGLMGRVNQMSSRSAQVVTLLDPTSRIPVEVGGVQAIASGTGGEILMLTHIKDAQHSLKVGDHVVTSGFGGIYPKGLPVGIISSIENKCIQVQPFEGDITGHSVVLIKSTPQIDDTLEGSVFEGTESVQ